MSFLKVNHDMSGQSLLMLDEPNAGRLTIQYGPNAGTDMVENPPRFSWLPVIEDEAEYVLRISADATYPTKTTHVFPNIPLNFFTPDVALAAGHYHWSYAVCDTTGKPVTNWSNDRTFHV